ncbi:hypothetical protein BOO71_0011107 [Deinococcus marmoris]|uniref:Uncharacterized protein n=1 Tax=Deinococcus marmoris TaxID=249408 RepID=A0A1U7NUU5_9DEIO|nr:hypothetical protein BOO71_0011107 [Deinococcus marmoris]
MNWAGLAPGGQLQLKNPALKVQGFKVRLKVAVNAIAFRS